LPNRQAFFVLRSRFFASLFLAWVDVHDLRHQAHGYPAHKRTHASSPRPLAGAAVITRHHLCAR
jgi:hypothetical protein